MKVGLSKGIGSGASSGKRKFMRRLEDAFRDLGVTITTKYPDVYLRIPGDKLCSKTDINVLRLDGLWFNTEQNYKKQNHGLKKAIRPSFALIYQSQFCYKAYKNFLGIKKSYDIIPNGADPADFLPRKPENFFLAACRWRRHKRLKTIIKSFLLALEKGLDADLIVAGKPDYKVGHARIKYLGWCNDKTLANLLSRAIASIHLTWLDWCPNSLVESLVAGCPVIFTDSGGHAEIASGAGLSIEDKPWNFKPCKLYRPPPVSKAAVAAAMLEMKHNTMVIDVPSLHIHNIAKRYLQYFVSLLDARR